jgi:hypothetical protein
MENKIDVDVRADIPKKEELPWRTYHSRAILCRI